MEFDNKVVWGLVGAILVSLGAYLFGPEAAQMFKDSVEAAPVTTGVAPVATAD